MGAANAGSSAAVDVEVGDADEASSGTGVALGKIVMSAAVAGESDTALPPFCKASVGAGLRGSEMSMRANAMAGRARARNADKTRGANFITAKLYGAKGKRQIHSAEWHK